MKKSLSNQNNIWSKIESCKKQPTKQIRASELCTQMVCCTVLTSSDSSERVFSNMGNRLSVCRNIYIVKTDRWMKLRNACSVHATTYQTRGCIGGVKDYLTEYIIINYIFAMIIFKSNPITEKEHCRITSRHTFEHSPVEKLAFPLQWLELLTLRW